MLRCIALIKPADTQNNTWIKVFLSSPFYKFTPLLYNNDNKKYKINYPYILMGKSYEKISSIYIITCYDRVHI